MAKQITVGPVADLPPGAVTGAGPYAIGNIDGKHFAVTRRCRHLRADLAGGSIEDGRLVCPWHQSAYDVENGQMVRGPQQIFAKIPGLGTTFCEVVPNSAAGTACMRDLRCVLAAARHVRML